MLDERVPVLPASRPAYCGRGQDAPIKEATMSTTEAGSKSETASPSVAKTDLPT